MLFGELKQSRGIVHIKANWCKGCGFCVQHCPTDVLEMSVEYNAKGYHPPFVKTAADCTDCKFCELICPEFAIHVETDRVEEETVA